MRHRLRKRRLHSVRRSASAGRAKRRIGRVLRGWMPGLLLVPGLCLGPVDPGFAEESNDSVPGTTEDAADPRWTGPLTAQWQHDLGRSIEHPLILNEGALIVTTTDRRIVSLDLATGKRHWRRRFKEDIPVPPALLPADDPAGRVVVFHGRPEDGRLRLLDGRTGKDLWSLDWKSRPVHLSGNRDRVWLLLQNGKLLGLSTSDGKKEWEVRDLGWDSPSFADDGETLFVLERSDSLHAFDGDDGTRSWSIALAGRFAAPPTITGNTLLVVNTTGTLWEIDRESGAILGSSRRVPGQLTPPVPSADRIVTAAASGVVESRDLAGEGWSFESGEALESVPVPAGPIILLGTSGGELLALRTDRGELAWSLDLKSRFKTAPLVTDRFLVLATSSGDIYVYQHDS
ncbi:MAG: PQQ-binding-like beta-propeller repeat protein [Candidatus Eisenbacteria bacterium]|uniref:PQQ-binding-like beta-propeller repeat protein n=1 Tax=Eiseniibacteriota bacterium TaxID=2212470 RepID=A0A956LVW7_UNCEI|nr:PQQ-binding-like beta-propeller repeat protein [Candidatus Eisenbacteria bacterium]